MEIQQSSLYAQYIQRLGWQVEEADGSHLFVKRFPFYGGFAKLQRFLKLPKMDSLLPILTKYHVKKFGIEPDASIDQNDFSLWIKKIAHHVDIVSTPYLPTKTIRVDLTGSEEEMFARFSEAKRRAVRRALKNNLRICESANIEDLIKIKNKSSGFLGFITTTGIDKLWPIFAPNHATILLAHSPIGHWKLPACRRGRDIGHSHIVGGILLLFYDDIAYYWIAGATREGKKLFAPTLLVWEAIKLAKKRECKQFDFVGVWDERIPNENKQWQGFTKFKEGFGGTSLYYPIAS